MSKQGFYVFIFLSLLEIFSTTPCLAQTEGHKIYLDSQLVSTSLRHPIDANKFLLNLWKQGYLFAQVQSQSDTATYIYKGEKREFEVRSINDSLCFEDNKPLQLAASKLEYHNNHGFPFCNVQLTDPRQTGSSLSVNLQIDQGPFVEFDSLVLSKKIRTNQVFIERTLGIERGEPYSESAYRKVDQRMSRMPFLEQVGPKDISFKNGKSSVYLELKEQSSNSFEGVLSLLPNQSTNGLMFTGFVNLHLDNLFYSGKSLSLEWNRFDIQSQSLDFSYHHPFIGGTKLLVGVDFALLKQDTSFISRNFDLAVGTYLTDKGIINFNYHKSGGTLIDGDSATFTQTGAVDFERNLYGVSFNYGQYAQPVNYGNQFKSFVSVAFGDKKINENTNINSEAYDSLSQNSRVLMLDIKLKAQRILAKRTVLFNQMEFGSIVNDRVFSNEVYRLGGLRTLRGFNEQSIYSSQYALSRLELRQYFESRSHFMLFYDQLYTRYDGKTDWPLGFGVGFSLSSNRSLFNFAMALGKSKDYPLDLANIKIHFGYISKF